MLVHRRSCNSETADPSVEYAASGYERIKGAWLNVVRECGTHDFETKNLKEFNNHIHKTHNEGSTPSKAASVTSSANKAKEIHGFS